MTPKGKQLYNAIIQAKNVLDYVSSGRPTYWSADPKKLPDLVDFAIAENILKIWKAPNAFRIFHLITRLPCLLYSDIQELWNNR